ncbi:hypothetical protein DFP93_102434 [Aneurinibacillus soli]|uniref:Uncharacterized protein n=2 Tax=Aneurinibacillus soli TaxID=1500254 RepID=A0A0U4WF09_9BACL|nr:hypothetical protein [Aneurinibacillus soli]PYE63744.1 hypothetical protein DFP93_102434 [Aneurinibacillus soli]BAU27323.1 hypothetical protein CB4_01497 [Aneurinibacillus soli]
MLPIRSVNVTHDVMEILHVAQILEEKNRPCTLYLSIVPLAVYRQHTEQTALGFFQWPLIHQGRCIRLRSAAICHFTHSISFFDEEENIFYHIKNGEPFLIRKNTFLLDNEEKIGFLEIITRKERGFLSFSLSRWPLRFT